MDMSMILGLTLAGSIMLISGSKRPEKGQKNPIGNNPEFIVSVGADGGLSISPKEKKES